jgi:uncharacterized protein YegL
MTAYDGRQTQSSTFQPGLSSGRAQPIPIVLLVDTSTSMQGHAIGELNNALVDWERDLKNDEYLRQQGEIALVSFGNGGVTIITGSSSDATGAFVRVEDFRAPTLTANGVTPMVDAIRKGIDLANERRRLLRSQGIVPYRPTLYMISDGFPTDAKGELSKTWHEIVPEIREAEERKHLLFFALGVANADEDVLRQLAPNGYYKADGLQFRRVLRMVSASSGSVGKHQDPRESFERIRRLLESEN